MLWLAGQSLASKAITFVGQLVLAWLLVPEDFGVYAACIVALQFTNALRSGGLGPVLVQRHKRIDLWGPIGFQLSAVLGVASMLLVGFATPALLAGLDADVPGYLAWLVAMEVLWLSLSIVPRAKLQSEMRFGFIATLGIVCGVLQVGGQVGLAAMTDLGVVALVLPRPVVMFLRFAAMLVAARPRLLAPVRLQR